MNTEQRIKEFREIVPAKLEIGSMAYDFSEHIFKVEKWLRKAFI